MVRKIPEAVAIHNSQAQVWRLYACASKEIIILVIPLPPSRGNQGNLGSRADILMKAISVNISSPYNSVVSIMFFAVTALSCKNQEY